MLEVLYRDDDKTNERLWINKIRIKKENKFHKLYI